VLMRVGLFNESLRRAEDHDLWLRLCRHHQFWLVPEALTLYERQPHSLSRNRGAMAAADITVLKPILAQPLSAAQRSSVKKRLARRYFDLSYVTRESNSREAVSLAWQSLRTDPTRLASLKLLAVSLLAAGLLKGAN
jgi:hypothetical protein